MIFNNLFYSGRDEKYGVSICGKNYLLKPIKGRWGLAKMMSELTASVVYKQLELPVQNVSLIKWNNAEAILIEDFLNKDYYFVPFASLIEENFDKYGDTSYSYENIRHTLLTYKYIENGQECLKAFWDMFVVDFLIGGGGRNASNWGFIGHKGRLSPAPVFDSSSSFYYKDYSESGFAEPGDITLPRMTFGGKICTRIDVISSHRYKECSDSVQYAIEHFSVEEISEMLLQTGMKKDMAEKWFIPILKYNFKRLEGTI